MLPENGGDFEFALEARGEYLARQLGGEDLDDDRAMEGELGRQKDAAHSPASELSLDAIGIADGVLKSRLEVAHSPKRWPTDSRFMPGDGVGALAM
jgi:hypothetical protein